jgi:hypothetical protein
MAISITTTGVMAQSWDVDNEKPPAIGSERARPDRSDQQPSLDYPCQVRVSGDSCRIAVDLVIDERQRWPVVCEFQTFDSIIVGAISLLSAGSDVPKPSSRIATTGDVLWLKLHYLTDTASYRLMYMGERWQADCVCRQPFVYVNLVNSTDSIPPSEVPITRECR